LKTKITEKDGWVWEVYTWFTWREQFWVEIKENEMKEKLISTKVFRFETSKGTLQKYVCLAPPPWGGGVKWFPINSLKETLKEGKWFPNNSLPILGGKYLRTFEAFPPFRVYGLKVWKENIENLFESWKKGSLESETQGWSFVAFFCFSSLGSVEILFF